MKDFIIKTLKSKLFYVIVLAIAGLLGGGAYSDQIVQMIMSVLGQ